MLNISGLQDLSQRRVEKLVERIKELERQIDILLSLKGAAEKVIADTIFHPFDQGALLPPSPEKTETLRDSLETVDKKINMRLLDKSEVKKQHKAENEIEDYFEDLMADRVRIYVPFGWEDLIWDMLEKISEKGLLRERSIVQIKEKFANLRVYFDQLVDDEVDAIVNEAKRKAKNTCQVCGSQPAEKVTDGWAYRLCDHHKQEMQQKSDN